MIDSATGPPVYRQLADEIRAAIEGGNLRPGQRLRTEPEYADEYGIGRASVRQAMAVLRSEGLIVTTKQGSRVRPQTPAVDIPIADGTRVSARMPTTRERGKHGLPEGVPVFVLERPGQDQPEIVPADRAMLIVRHVDAAGDANQRE